MQTRPYAKFFMPSSHPHGEADSPKGAASPHSPSWKKRAVRGLALTAGVAAGTGAALALAVGLALTVAYPNLPDVSDLLDYRPKLPLRVYSADGVILGEFGEERRQLTPIQDIPKVMKDAVLAIEDARFYSHGGVDYLGVIRAGMANVGRLKSQGCLHDHHAGGAQCLPVAPRKPTPARSMRIADLQAGTSADQRPDSRDLYEPDLSGQ
jgi:hypothetical protein